MPRSRRIGEIAHLGPAGQRRRAPPADEPHQPSQPERERPAPAILHRRARSGEQRVLGAVSLGTHRVVAQLYQHGRDVDLDRADLVAVAAVRVHLSTAGLLEREFQRL
jgi:hypothetical protein